MLNHWMNTRTLRLAVFAVAMATAAVVVSVPAAAKEKALSQSELKNLMTNAETKAEHARLAQHFEAEAARYEAESKEHADLAQFYQQHTSATPTKYPGGQESFQHCDALSKSLQQAAANARELAAAQRRMENEAKK